MLEFPATAVESAEVATPLDNRQPYLEVASAIAAHLARTAIWDGERCNWLGSAVDVLNGSMQLVERTPGGDVYNGTAGIALFLALMQEHHPDPLVGKALLGAVHHLLSLEPAAIGPVNYGYFTGRLGIASTLIGVGEQQQRPDWQERGWALVKELCEQPIQAFEVDVLSGVAGAIPTLLKLYARRAEPVILDALTLCGNFLLARAHKSESAWCWTAVDSQPPLTGYSHGAAGIALALLELYAVTANPAYFTGAMMGFNFERLHYNQQVQNWPDLRSTAAPAPGAAPVPATPLTYGEAWCHGAPGIALSRLRAWQLTGDPTFRQEAEAALATTWRHIYSMGSTANATPNFSLCHGLAGNADIMLEGSKVLQNPQYAEIARQVGNLGIERYHQYGLSWPSGVSDPSGTTAGLGETPNLLLGVAGTGYFYLRLAFPERIPCLLLA
jgi:lantibiotic biosynthesis protein